MSARRVRAQDYPATTSKHSQCLFSSTRTYRMYGSDSWIDTQLLKPPGLTPSCWNWLTFKEGGWAADLGLSGRRGADCIVWVGQPWSWGQ